MNSLTALSLSIGVLAGLATFLAVGPFSGVFLIWVATISWAAYFALGGDDCAAKNTLICSVFGTAMATYAAIEITGISATATLGFPAMAAIIVTITVIVTCLAANLPALSAIPASVLGYSSTFGYLLQTPDVMTREVLLSFSWANPCLIISFSLAIGVGFGIASNKLAAVWTTVK